MCVPLFLKVLMYLLHPAHDDDDEGIREETRHDNARAKCLDASMKADRIRFYMDREPNG